MRIDERAARCFAHLRAPEFISLVEYFRAVRQERLERLAMVMDQDQIYRLQGEAGMLKEILDNIEGAEVLIAKLKR